MITSNLPVCLSLLFWDSHHQQKNEHFFHFRSPFLLLFIDHDHNIITIIELFILSQYRSTEVESGSTVAIPSTNDEAKTAKKERHSYIIVWQ